MLTHRTKQDAYFKKGVDALLFVIAFLVAFYLRKHFSFLFDPTKDPVFASHVWILVLAVPLHWMIAGLTHRPGQGIIVAVAQRFLWLGLVLGTCVFSFKANTVSRAVLILFLALGFLLVTSSRFALRALTRGRRKSQHFWKNLLIVGTGPEARSMAGIVEADAENGLRVIGHVTAPSEGDISAEDLEILGSVEDLASLVDKHVVDDVVFALPQSAFHELRKYVAWCEEIGVTVHIKMPFLQEIASKSLPTTLGGAPMLTLTMLPTDPVALTIKRVVDLLLSGVALLALSPVFLLAFLAVRLSSRGPAIFKQQRVGLNGRAFTMYKFRSMYVDAESRRAEMESLNEVSGPVFKCRRDPRITPVGRFLRKYSIDELPQLVNVFVGSMSLVGPRPPIAEEVRQYQRWQRRRLSMRPGITCLWQIAGRSDVPFHEWMNLDLEYIDHWSLALDLKILLRTLPVVVLAKGAR